MPDAHQAADFVGRPEAGELVPFEQFGERGGQEIVNCYKGSGGAVGFGKVGVSLVPFFCDGRPGGIGCLKANGRGNRGGRRVESL